MPLTIMKSTWATTAQYRFQFYSVGSVKSETTTSLVVKYKVYVWFYLVEQLELQTCIYV